MRNLINRLLVRLGLRKPKYDPLPWIGNVGWKWYGGYGRMNNKDFIVRGDIVDE